MKTCYLHQVLTVLFSCLISASAIAQKDYQKGYVITTNKDTLWGFVKNRKPPPFGKIYSKIRFKGKRRKKRYGPDDIHAYEIGNKYYESVWVDTETTFLSGSLFDSSEEGQRQFLRVGEKGALTHYILEFQEQGEELVQEIDYFKKEGRPQLIRVTQGLFGLKRKRVIAFLSDCSSLVDKIERKKLKYAFEVVHYYNNVCPTEK